MSDSDDTDEDVDGLFSRATERKLEQLRLVMEILTWIGGGLLMLFELLRRLAA